MRKLFIFCSKAFIFIAACVITILIVGYAVASYHKKDILAYINTEINNGISGKAKLDNISFTIFQQFPSVSLTLHGLTIQDSVYQSEVIKSEKVFLQVQLLNLLNKELHIKSIVVQNSVLNVFKDSLGYNNMSIFRKKNNADTPKKTDNSMMDFRFRKILFRNVIVNYLDESKKKKIHVACKNVELRLKHTEEHIACLIVGNVFSEGLLFNDIRGPFIKDKDLKLNLDLIYSKTDSLVILKPSFIICEDQKYEVQGKSFLNSKYPKIFLAIKCDEADYDKATSILNTHLRKTLSRFKITGSFKTNVELLLDTKPGVQPAAKVDFKIENRLLKFIDYNLENTSLEGSFSNREDSLKPCNDGNSVLVLKSSSFVYHDIKMNVKGSLHNLVQPRTKINAVFTGNLISFHHFLDTTVYQFSNGSFCAELNQEGPMSLINIPDPVIMKGLLYGKVDIQDGKLKMNKKSLTFSAVNGKMDFKDKDLDIRSLTAILNGNEILLNGKLTGIVPFLLFPEKNVKARLAVSSPYFNLNRLLVKGLGGKGDNTVKSSKPLMAHIHKILNRIELELNTKVKVLEYKKLVTGSLNGKISLTKENIKFSDWILNLSPKGKIKLNGLYDFQKNDSGTVKMNVDLSSIDASKLFYGFDNFGQAALKSDQIGGLIDAKITFNCRTDDNFNPIQKTVAGNIQLVLKEGELKNFEPLRKVGNLVFKDRDLMHIKFDEIHNVFLLNGEEMHIQKMIINSSALSIYVEGIFSFKHNTDLSIQIPLSNFKENDKLFIQVKDIEHGNIRLRAKEKDGKMNVGLDLFDRYHKKHSN